MTTTFNMLDVAIGLAVVYLLLSLICSSVGEGIESLCKNRSRQLERGIREILNDPDGNRMTDRVYNHPLISSLFQGGYDPKHLRKSFFGQGKTYGRANLPSYIPATSFALAVLDIVHPASADHRGGAAATFASPGAPPAPPELAESLRSAIGAFPMPEVSRSLLILLDASGNDLMRVRMGIEWWFNNTMDRVSGWYKRRTQKILFVVSLTMAAVLNVDTIGIANRLAADPALRSTLVATAQEYARNDRLPREAASPVEGDRWRQAAERTDRVERNLDRIRTLGLPIGWSEIPRHPYDWLLKAAGILGSALAAALGAPFWFDLLNRFMVVRSTVKPREKSREETSKE